VLVCGHYFRLPIVRVAMVFGRGLPDFIKWIVIISAMAASASSAVVGGDRAAATADAAPAIVSATKKRKKESVWDYPRPAVLVKCEDEIRVVHDGVEIIRTTNGMRVLETSHPPTYYMPISEINPEVKFQQVSGGSFCEWKGRAVYFDIIVRGKRIPRAAWAYPNPTTKLNPAAEHGWKNIGRGQKKGTGGSFGPIAKMFAVYCTKMDECYVAGERSKPQDGGFYGGWKNSWIDGGERGMKGPPGTSFF